MHAHGVIYQHNVIYLTINHHTTVLSLDHVTELLIISHEHMRGFLHLGIVCCVLAVTA